MVTIVDLIPDTEQTLYPSLDGDLCVHARLVDASCRACIGACPRDAWELTDVALEIDTERCDGCGLCIPACPQAALSLPIKPAIRLRGREKVAMAACDRVAGIAEEAIVPCIHRFGVREVMDGYGNDIREWVIATGDCAGCERSTKKSFQLVVKLLNLALKQRGLPGIRLHESTGDDWASTLAEMDSMDHMPVSRRNFFRGIAGQAVDAEKQECDEPANPPRLKGDGLQPWRCSIDTDACDFCDACRKVCPTGALRLEKGEVKQFIVDSECCNGCMLCVDVCDADAVSVSPWKIVSLQAIACVEKRCERCGVGFLSSPVESGSICRICSKIDHRKILFQTIT